MHGFLDYCRNPLQVEIFVKLSLHHIGFLMEQPWSEQRMASMFARIAAGRWDMCKELAYTSGQKIRNYTTSDWIAFGTLPNSGTARAHTESKPSFIRPFSRLSTFFQLLASEIQLSLPFSPSRPDYMSSYRKTMPSFTLVLTSGHPSFRSPTIQPSSAMLPTSPDFLMVYIWLSVSHPCWF